MKQMKQFVMMTLAGVMLVSGGCRGDRSEKPPRQFLPDMDDSPKWKPQSEQEFFADSRGMRPEVSGTVPFSRTNVGRDWMVMSSEARPVWYDRMLADRADLLREQWESYEGAIPKKLTDGKIDWAATSTGDFAKVVDRIPPTVSVSEALLRRGEERFNIYCATCHGYEGDGKGTVGVQWTGGARNLREAAYRDPNSPKAKDGYLFYVARHGFRDATGAEKMPGYGHALSAYDSWAVVAWLRVLQETSVRNGTAPAATPAATPSTAAPGGKS